MELQPAATLDRINRLMQDRQINHSQELQKLRRDYNRVVNKMHNDSFTPPSDILDMFPSEVWIQIVKGALPVRGCNAALLLLTMVSNRWMQELLSVPTLWACIELGGLQEDSLATIETFKQLSSGASLHLFIDIPTYHDNSVICAILTSIGPRLREATIRFDTNGPWRHEEIWAVLQLLITGSKFNSNLIYIRTENSIRSPLGDGGAQLLRNHLLPPLLRAIRGWSFAWWEFQMVHDYLERVEYISSDSPIEFVLSGQIQLPNLRSLEIIGHHILSHNLKCNDQEGFPPLRNLTTLVYKSCYRQVFVKLLLSVAPQLVHLELSVSYYKIPLVAAGLQAAINLRKLTVDVEECLEDERVNESYVSPVYQHVTGDVCSLRDLTFRVLSGGHAKTQSQVTRRGPFLIFLVSMISALYTEVERLELFMVIEYSRGSVTRPNLRLAVWHLHGSVQTNLDRIKR